ncbi:methionine ABC transporter permease [Shimazuella alba]|uniref:Methionine ABC transporter permease MetI n=1 Tax=Shimazuella alba TaxID=2690964 RepID=A0A6I4VY19_9BACL|nr:methionine ABC transporter permease [Shimazuella alba]MXQ54865.1 methionine ABC transporter permease MetI [Shimazuella alba]
MAFDWAVFWPQLIDGILATLIMVIVSLAFSVLIGFPLGVVLVVTRPGHILENRIVYAILSTIINIFRSVPFIILLVAIIPFTRLVTGSSIGTAAAIVPLIFYAAPYVGRLVENSLLEVEPGVVEAAQAMGATPWQIIWRFLLPEALSSLFLAATIATIGLIGASAMAGAVGGGGLGDLAITYGYNQFEVRVIVITVVLLIIFVQLVQSLGNYLAQVVRRK